MNVYGEVYCLKVVLLLLDAPSADCLEITEAGAPLVIPT